MSADEKALEVDHILPRNSGGSDEEHNLQALCYSCNATKRDRDDTDFRGMASAYLTRSAGCHAARDAGRIEHRLRMAHLRTPGSSNGEAGALT